MRGFAATWMAFVVQLHDEARRLPPNHGRERAIARLWRLAIWLLLQQPGRVPRRLICDNESGIGRGKADTEGVVRSPAPWPPHLRWLRPADFDAQFTDWLAKANARVVRTSNARPIDLLDADRTAMLPLPPVAPVVGWVNRVRLGRDYDIRPMCLTTSAMQARPSPGHGRPASLPLFVQAPPRAGTARSGLRSSPARDRVRAASAGPTAPGVAGARPDSVGRGVGARVLSRAAVRGPEPPR